MLIQILQICLNSEEIYIAQGAATAPCTIYGGFIKPVGRPALKLFDFIHF